MNILLKGIGCFPLINACIKDPILYMYKLFTVSTRVLKKSGLVCVNFGAFDISLTAFFCNFINEKLLVRTWYH